MERFWLCRWEHVAVDGCQVPSAFQRGDGFGREQSLREHHHVVEGNPAQSTVNLHTLQRHGRLRAERADISCCEFAARVIAAMNTQAGHVVLRREERRDVVARPAVVPRYEGDARGEFPLAHAFDEAPIFEEAVAVALQQRIVDDEAGPWVIVVPDTVPQGSSQKHHQRDQPGEPGQHTRLASYLLVQVGQFGASREEQLTPAERRADKARAVAGPDERLVARFPAAVDEMFVNGRVRRSEGETRKLATPLTMVVYHLKFCVPAQWLDGANTAGGQCAEHRVVTLRWLKSIDEHMLGDVR